MRPAARSYFRSQDRLVLLWRRCRSPLKTCKNREQKAPTKNGARLSLAVHCSSIGNCSIALLLARCCPRWEERLRREHLDSSLSNPLSERRLSRRKRYRIKCSPAIHAASPGSIALCKGWVEISG